MVAGVTPEEARWLNTESARDLDYQETPREQALEYCRHLVGRYGGADQLAQLPLEDAGPCADCQETVETRYRIGRYALCRHDAISRLRARAHTDKPLRTPTTYRTPIPADPHGYIVANARNITPRTLRTLLRDWRIDPDYAVELLDLHADLTHPEAA